MSIPCKVSLMRSANGMHAQHAAAAAAATQSTEHDVPSGDDPARLQLATIWWKADSKATDSCTMARPMAAAWTKRAMLSYARRLRISRWREAMHVTHRALPSGGTTERKVPDL